MNKIETDIVIIDSGVNLNHREFNDDKIRGLYLNFNEETSEMIVDNNDYVNDQVGHGTAVTSIIRRQDKNSSIFMIKLFNEEFLDHPRYLIEALNFIYNNIQCNVINISSGVTCCSELQDLENICNIIVEQGTIIVSAFDNRGIVSYPAAFESVIGVDIEIMVTRMSDYIYVENDIVNLIGTGLQLRVPWLDNEYIKIAGASFVAPYFSGRINKIMKEGIKDKNKILEYLKNNSSKIIRNNKYLRKMNSLFQINNAVLFPLNKEIHSIIRFVDYLGFNITNIYDSKYIGNVGSNVKELINVDMDKTVENIDNIDWNNDFDTFILGHVRHLSSLLGRDYIKSILIKCYENNKNLVAFDNLSGYEQLLIKFDESGLEYYYPKIYDQEPNYNSSKLKLIGKPILGIFGTSSRQGKFTLQIELKKRFENVGYKVGFLGTEPSSILFGANEVYPMGYDGRLSLEGEKAVKLINNLMGNIEYLNPDLILVGSQSQTIPSDYGNIDMYPLKQHEFLLGTLPDAVILCVNYFDDYKYISNTINYIETIGNCEVIALVLSPVNRNFEFSILDNTIAILNKDRVINKKTDLENTLNIKAYSLSIDSDLDELYNKVINLFTQ